MLHLPSILNYCTLWSKLTLFLFFNLKFKPSMSSTEGRAVVVTLNTLENTSGVINGHISTPGKEQERCVGPPCKSDSPLSSSARCRREISLYCLDSTYHTLNSGKSFLGPRRDKLHKDRSETGPYPGRHRDGKFHKSKIRTWFHILYNVRPQLAVYHTDCTWSVEYSSSLVHGFSQHCHDKSGKGKSFHNTVPGKNISLHNARKPPSCLFLNVSRSPRPSTQGGFPFSLGLGTSCQASRAPFRKLSPFLYAPNSALYFYISACKFHTISLTSAKVCLRNSRRFRCTQTGHNLRDIHFISHWNWLFFLLLTFCN